MAENSLIEWTDHTFNPWIGCTKVGPGCEHCYAEALMDKRHHRVEWGGDRSRTGMATWAMPLRWERAATAFWLKHRRQQRVFCSSLADVFDNHRSIQPEWRADLAKLILRTPSLDWLLLTKRIGNALDFLIQMFPDGVPMNVRVGATVVNQDEWARDCRKIAQVSVACEQKPFLSIEPILGGFDFAAADPTWQRYVGWAIVGGESGRNARCPDPWAIRDVRDQCARGPGVPFLFKQWGEWGPVPGNIQEGDVMMMRARDETGFLRDGVTMRRIGKKAAGRTLDGVTHTEFPR